MLPSMLEGVILAN